MTTTVATMEQLLGIETGGVITVGTPDNVWVRQDGGNFGRSGFSIEPSNFEGEVAASRVTIGVRPQRGQVWHEPWGYNHLILSDCGDGTYWTARVSTSGTFRRIIKLNSLPGQVMDTAPDWVNLVLAMGDAIVSRETAIEEYQRQASEQREQQRAVVERVREERNTEWARLQSALHEHMENEGLNGSSPLAELMEAHGFELPPEQVTVTITVEGQSEVWMDADDLSPRIEGDVRITEGVSMTVDWTRMLSTTVDVAGGGCGCGEVDRGTVRELLTDAGVSYSNFEWECECPAD